MDTVTVNITGLNLQGNIITEEGLVTPIDTSNTQPVDKRWNVYIKANITGTVSNASEHKRITTQIGGIEWKVTATRDGNPLPLTPHTYVDAYGKLHLGDDIELEDVISVGARLVNANPSGSGYEITSASVLVFKISDEAMDGNFNAAENLPYITYQLGDSQTPASGFTD